MVSTTHNICVLYTKLSVGYPIDRRYFAAYSGLNLAASGYQKFFPCCNELSALSYQFIYLFIFFIIACFIQFFLFSNHLDLNYCCAEFLPTIFL